MTRTASPRTLGDVPPQLGVGPVLALATAEGETTTATRTSADVYVYGNIGGWFGVDADDFVRDVAGLDVDQLVVHLNSPGGDAFEGVAIANVLRAHRAHVVVRVDGMAASAASVVAMAGDEVVMGIGSQLMVHDPWIYAGGNAADLEAVVRRLHSSGDSLAGTYAAKAGGTPAEWREVMKAETWYTPEEAVAAGLANRVAAADEVATAEGEQITPGESSSDWWSFWDQLSATDRFDLSGFRFPGREHAPPPAMPGRTTPAASAVGQPNPPRGGGAVPTFLDNVRQRLGVAADADETTALAALDEALEERGETTQGALPDGVVAVDQATLDQMRTDAELGRAAHARQAREDRERLVAAAVADGRIPPARREAWITMLAADPGAAEQLAGLARGTVPVAARGHDHDAPDDDEDAPSLQAGADLYNSRNGKKG